MLAGMNQINKQNRQKIQYPLHFAAPSTYSYPVSFLSQAEGNELPLSINTTSSSANLPSKREAVAKPVTSSDYGNGEKYSEESPQGTQPSPLSHDLKPNGHQNITPLIKKKLSYYYNLRPYADDKEIYFLFGLSKNTLYRYKQGCTSNNEVTVEKYSKKAPHYVPKPNIPQKSTPVIDRKLNYYYNLRPYAADEEVYFLFGLSKNALYDYKQCAAAKNKLKNMNSSYHWGTSTMTTSWSDKMLNQSVSFYTSVVNPDDQLKQIYTYPFGLFVPLSEAYTCPSAMYSRQMEIYTCTNTQNGDWIEHPNLSPAILAYNSPVVPEAYFVPTQPMNPYPGRFFAPYNPLNANNTIQADQAGERSRVAPNNPTPYHSYSY